MLDENPVLQTCKYINTAQEVGSVFFLHQNIGIDKHGDTAKLIIITYSRK
jgi:hypothetical protein